MDSLKGLFSPNEGQGLKSKDTKENHIQGLYYDLLSCLAGGDNPRLPPGYKQKPMTGFCDILDAFNETIKIREAGSGIVCEINSSDVIDAVGPDSKKASNETLKASPKESNVSLDPESIKSCSGNELSTSETDQDRSRSSSSIPNVGSPKESHLELFQKMTQKILSDESIFVDQKVQNLLNQTNTNMQSSDNENYEDAFDFDGPNPVVAMLKSTIQEAVGQPPQPPQPPTPTLSESQPDSDTPEDSPPLSADIASVHQHSADPSKDVEKILNENPFVPTHNHNELKDGMMASVLIGDGIIPSFPVSSPAVIPSEALEKMYYAESFNCPDHQITDIHKSCKPIVARQANIDFPYLGLSAPAADPSPPLFPYCLNLESAISDADFLTALEMKMKEEGAAGRAHGNRYDASRETNVHHPVFSDANQFLESAGIYMDQINGSDKTPPYYSVPEESDNDKSQASKAGNDKPKTQKRKTRLQRNRNASGSQECVRNGTSGSESEYTDAH